MWGFKGGDGWGFFNSSNLVFSLLFNSGQPMFKIAGCCCKIHEITKPFVIYAICCNFPLKFLRGCSYLFHRLAPHKLFDIFSMIGYASILQHAPKFRRAKKVQLFENFIDGCHLHSRSSFNATDDHRSNKRLHTNKTTPLQSRYLQSLARSCFEEVRKQEYELALEKVLQMWCWIVIDYQIR